MYITRHMVSQTLIDLMQSGAVASHSVQRIHSQCEHASCHFTRHGNVFRHRIHHAKNANIFKNPVAFVVQISLHSTEHASSRALAFFENLAMAVSSKPVQHRPRFLHFYFWNHFCCFILFGMNGLNIAYSNTLLQSHHLKVEMEAWFSRAFWTSSRSFASGEW